ncbi:MAG TPA: hypothetical protein ENN72_06870 [Firmicutes bacterium]|nr:hypothetical protein [Bacillota bacterium]
MIKKTLLILLLLFISNVFMTLAWYGHLKMKSFRFFSEMSLFFIIVISWSIAFFEYSFQIPANRIGFNENGGPFTLVQLKILQETISLSVFMIIAHVIFKTGDLRINHGIAFLFLILAVYFAFKP